MTKADVLGPTTSPPLLFSSSSSPSPSLSSLPLMASVAARFNRLHHSSLFLAPCLGQPASSSRSLLCLPSHRHAMMSALSHDHPRHPPSSPSPSSSSASPSPTLGETPPVVIPSPSTAPSAKHLSPDAHSPQVAARPPSAPKAERPKPTLRATKAAITVVRPSSCSSIWYDPF